MNLGHDIARELPGLRAQAESRMRDKVQVGIYRDGTDETTGDPMRVLVTERYDGKARIRWGSREVTNTNAPAMPVTVQEPYLSVPFGTARFFDGDEVLCVGSDDPILIDRVFRVQGDATAGQVTAHRYPLEELG